ncbi:hypothetical protein FRACYDRAFT_236461 [Fragilariopsis cylindrus CCMP1102]|uniref:LSM domain-containing protein n=1 Tax=Fragilariopsis cylindrus CCMP1102 TaxID=635003 RepID=A0A1E7FJ40_9STRA|nr:hypothetical protein FRACYDRAFT_236461 [Fragilariopsis cylindrus CCMP1102]|eukprot:OEU18190.1 hypothetical protein FRACYDRAFT_236461 [Fragilariopsis cylindrus CCMP1102]
MSSSLSFAFAFTFLVCALPSIVEAFTTNNNINININNNNIYHHQRQQQHRRQSQQHRRQSQQQILHALPNGYKEFGERIIREAAIECGMVLDDTGTGADTESNENGTEPEIEISSSTAAGSTDIIKNNKLDIEWKAGSIIVTVHGDVLLSAIPIEHAENEITTEEGADEDVDADDDETTADDVTADLFGDDDDAVDDDIENNKDEQQQPAEEPVDENARGAIDIALLARTINRMLDPPKKYGEDDNNDEDNEDEDDDNNGIINIGLAIAEVHSIEVTTPGVSDDLMILIKTNPQILNVYKGFVVLIQQIDKKTVKKAKTKQKTIEGRLVSYDNEFTIININGRMKTIRNDTIISMKLPKAKKEKGSR